MKKPKIMIIDDEKNIVKMLKLNLDATDKYEVRVNHEPLKAISAIAEFFPDLLILDVMMPGLQGSEIAEMLAVDPKLKNIRVLFLTALAKNNQLKVSRSIEGRRFIAKPVKMSNLIACLDEELAEMTDND